MRERPGGRTRLRRRWRVGSPGEAARQHIQAGRTWGRVTATASATASASVADRVSCAFSVSLLWGGMPWPCVVPCTVESWRDGCRMKKIGNEI